jgi:hypothetical protein
LIQSSVTAAPGAGFIPSNLFFTVTSVAGDQSSLYLDSLGVNSPRFYSLKDFTIRAGSGGLGNLAFQVANGGNVSVNAATGLAIQTITPTVALDVNSDSIRLRNPKTDFETGYVGEIAWDANNFYVCTTANTWKSLPFEFVETDPVFTASPAAGISNTNISQWSEAYSWGDHSVAGYLTEEADPIFLNSPAGSITPQNILNWTNAHSWGNHANAGYLKDAPSDGNQYARQDGAWAIVSASGGGGTPGGSNEQIQWNNNGEFAGAGGILVKSDHFEIVAPLRLNNNVAIQGKRTDGGFSNVIRVGLTDNVETYLPTEGKSWILFSHIGQQLLNFTNTQHTAWRSVLIDTQYAAATSNPFTINNKHDQVAYAVFRSGKDTSQAFYLQFQDNSAAPKWNFGRSSANAFLLQDIATGVFPITAFAGGNLQFDVDAGQQIDLRANEQSILQIRQTGPLSIGKTISISGEPTFSGSTVTMDLGAGNHQTLDFSSNPNARGVKLFLPLGSAAGTILILENAVPNMITFQRDDAGQIIWLGGQPDWPDSGNGGKYRMISWRYQPTMNLLFLLASDINI